MALKARPVIFVTTMLGVAFLLSACHGYYGHHYGHGGHGGHGGYYHGKSYGHGESYGRGHGNRPYVYRGRGYRYRH